jgi:hypothetical protein
VSEISITQVLCVLGLFASLRWGSQFCDGVRILCRFANISIYRDFLISLAFCSNLRLELFSVFKED